MGRSRAITVALLVGASAAVFWPVLGHEFLDWDDNSNVYENPHLDPPSWRGVARFWRAPYESLYVPLTYTFWAALAALSGGPVREAARLFHASSLALHALNVLMVFALLRALLRVRHAGPRPDGAAQAAGACRAGSVADWAAAAGALLFAVHPLQVEAVAWVTGQKDLLSGLLCLIALWLYVRRAAQVEGSTSGAERGGGFPADLAVATAAFVLALLAKPSAVSLPVTGWLVGLALRRADGRRPLAPDPVERPVTPIGRGGARPSQPGHADEWRARCHPRRGLSMASACIPPYGRLLAGWLCAGAACVVLTRLVQSPQQSETASAWWVRPLVAGDAICWYVWKLAWPARLGLDHGRSPLLLASRGWFWVTGLLPFVAAALAPLARLGAGRIRRSCVSGGAGGLPFGLAAGVFVAGLLPVLGLVPFRYQNMSTVADRYAYLALLGPAILLAAAVRRLDGAGWGRLAARVACAAVLVLWSVRSHMQARVWRNTVAVFEHGIAVNPASWTLRNNLGVLLARQGRLADALEQFSEVVRRWPANTDAYINLGNACSARGAPAEAERHYRTALRLQPGDADTHYNLGIVLAEQGRFDEATRHYGRAIEIRPDYAGARFNLAGVLLRQGRRAEAAAQFSEVLRLCPEDRQAREALDGL